MRSLSLCAALLALALADGGLGSTIAKSARTVPCAFPDGWNPADHQRQAAGLPPTRDCAVDSRGQVIDSQGRRTS